VHRWSSVALVAAVLLAGCATVRRLGAPDTERLLMEAGFTRQPADSAMLATLTPYTLVNEHGDGATRYVYLDPRTCTCVFVGSRDAYAAYRRLALEERIAADQAWAARQGSEAP
jgi:hypothetical protein